MSIVSVQLLALWRQNLSLDDLIDVINVSLGSALLVALPLGVNLVANQLLARFRNAAEDIIDDSILGTPNPLNFTETAPMSLSGDEQAPRALGDNADDAPITRASATDGNDVLYGQREGFFGYSHKIHNLTLFPLNLFTWVCEIRVQFFRAFEGCGMNKRYILNCLLICLAFGGAKLFHCSHKHQRGYCFAQNRYLNVVKLWLCKISVILFFGLSACGQHPCQKDYPQLKKNEVWDAVAESIHSAMVTRNLEHRLPVQGGPAQLAAFFKNSDECIDCEIKRIRFGDPPAWRAYVRYKITDNKTSTDESIYFNVYRQDCYEQENISSSEWEGNDP